MTKGVPNSRPHHARVLAAASAAVGAHVRVKQGHEARAAQVAAARAAWLASQAATTTTATDEGEEDG